MLHRIVLVKIPRSCARIPISATVTHPPKSWKECKKEEGAKQLDSESEERRARSRYMDALPGRTSNAMQLQRCHLTAEYIRLLFDSMWESSSVLVRENGAQTARRVASATRCQDLDIMGVRGTSSATCVRAAGKNNFFSLC